MSEETLDQRTIRVLQMQLRATRNELEQTRTRLKKMHRRAQAAEAALPQWQELQAMRVPQGPPKTRALARWQDKAFKVIEGGS